MQQHPVVVVKPTKVETRNTTMTANKTGFNAHATSGDAAGRSFQAVQGIFLQF